MIDASGSQEKTLEAEKLIAIKFVENVIKKDKDRLAIVKFAQSVDVEQDFSSDFSKSVNTIKSVKLQKLGKRNTSLWDSLQTVTETLEKLSSSNKKVIVLISDGVENASKTQLDDVAKYLVKMQIPVYSIGNRGDFLGIEGELNLDLISRQTGGFPFFPNNEKELQNATLQIGQFLRQNFKVTFLANNLNPNDKIQKTEISIVNQDLKKAKLRIVQPKGFYFLSSK
ncbi:MAG: VWA domain-containing protein [Pyrinomonadaceae bacterium]|nr:VWA domain-containing protein [Pyrinomonadaceae bacterium]